MSIEESQYLTTLRLVLPRHGKTRSTIMRYVLVFFILFAFTSGSEAASIIVNTTVDENNEGPDCSLREALASANHGFPIGGCNGSPNLDHIEVQVGGMITLRDDLDPLWAASDIILIGNGIVIKAGDGKRILNVFEGELEVYDVIFRDGVGDPSGPIGFNDGGAVEIGSDAIATFTRCEFLNNEGGRGGAIVSYGKLTLEASKVIGNYGPWGGGGIYTRANVTISNSVISHNTQDQVGAVGGGIYCGGDPSFVPMVIENSEISFNSGIGGGGIYSSSCKTIMSNTTISNNKVGGGFSCNGPADIFNSTITANDGGSVSKGLQATVHVGHDAIRLFSTLITGNIVPDFIGTVESLGYNQIGIIDGGPHPGMIDGVNNDRIGVENKLGPLADNGGMSKSHLLLPGSISIDAGSCGASGITTDQRGENRAIDISNNDGIDPPVAHDACDVGAIEVIESDVATFPLELKAFLLGPFSDGLMGPSGSPTAAIYTVTIELRDQTDPSLVFSQRQGMIMGDGTVMNVDASSDFRIGGFSTDNHHVAIRHRNHLAVMTAVAPLLSTAGSAYDFTTASSQAYGVNPMTDLGGGIFGLWGGDGDQNGTTSASDFSSVWLPQNGVPTGYHQGDYNLDGEVTAFDFILVWLPSNGRSSQVP